MDNNEIKRPLRYRQKIDFISDKISDLPEIFTDSLAVDATLYRIQVAIDAIVGINAMIVKDKGRNVGDDYENINTLLKIKVLNNKLGDNLIKLNGLRNAIVHKYNSFEEKTVISNIDEIKCIIENFLDVAEHELKTIFKADKKRVKPPK